MSTVAQCIILISILCFEKKLEKMSKIYIFLTRRTLFLTAICFWLCCIYQEAEMEVVASAGIPTSKYHFESFYLFQIPIAK